MHKNDQRGMASLMVTTVLILVIALIIIGFSQVVRRNQRDTLNRQLSTQAFFAAESGVDKVVAILRDKLAASPIPPSDKTTCDPNADYPEIKLDDENVKITCVLVSSQLSTLVYSGVGEDSPLVIPLVTSGAPLAKVTLTWRSEDGGSTPSSTCSTATTATTYPLSSRTSWACGHGLLRTDLASQPNGSLTTAMSSFFYPRRDPSTSPISEGSAPTLRFATGGGLANGICSDVGGDPKCIVSINGLAPSTAYFLSLRSIYHNSAVTVSGQDATGRAVEFRGQALIDVTARAQDTLRRIQVRVPLVARDTSDLPAFPLETTGSLCKRFAVSPSFYSDDSSVTCD